MLKALRRYAKTESIENQNNEDLPKSIYEELMTQKAQPIIWETGNIAQIRSSLILRQAELILAETHLTGNSDYDWYTNNAICDLETKIANLRRWLAEAREKSE